MKKKFISLLLCILIFGVSVLPVNAASPFVHDYSGTLNTTEIQILSDWSAELKASLDLDIVLAVIPNLIGKTVQDFADDFYENNRYGDNGVLFLVDTGSRQWHISTSGTAISALSDRDLMKIEDAVIPYFSQNRFYDGFCRFLDILPDYVTNEEGSSFSIFTSLLIGAIIAGTILLIMRSGMNSKKPQRSAATYETEGSYHLRTNQDLFLYSNLSKRPRPQNNSSGGSSVHHSTSGRSHGGRGGRF